MGKRKKTLIELITGLMLAAASLLTAISGFLKVLEELLR